MNLSRRELKFQIPYSLIEPICDFIAPYCSLDHYAAIAPENYYVINTLYLDSEAMTLLTRKRENLPTRFSARLRSYGHDPKLPAFFEIKHKVNQWIVKRRAPITSWDTVRYLDTGEGDVNALPDFQNQYLREIMFHLVSMNLRPKMMTNYERKAYFGLYEPYTRVTFDRRLRTYPETEFNIFPTADKLANYDHKNQFVNQETQAVLELKCEQKVPKWFFDMIQRFELDHMFFSKFESSWNYLNDFEAMNEDFDRAPTMGLIR